VFNVQFKGYYPDIENDGKFLFQYNETNRNLLLSAFTWMMMQEHRKRINKNCGVLLSKHSPISIQADFLKSK